MNVFRDLNDDCMSRVRIINKYEIFVVFFNEILLKRSLEDS